MIKTEKYNLKVLVAEDDLPSRVFIGSVVGSLFDKVVMAENGKEGLELFYSEKPDIIVTDIGMPFLNGLDMSRQIRSSVPNIPIILTTAFDNKSILMEAIEIGINHYLTKPVVKHQIIEVLTKVANSILLEIEVKKQQENIRMLYSAIEHSSGLVTIFDLNGNVSYVNPKFVDITGFHREEIYGRKFTDFLNLSGESYLDFIASIEEQRDWHGELSVKSSSGNNYFVYVSLSPILSLKGEYLSYVLVADDITEKKLVEKKLKEYNELLEEKVRERTAELHSINEQLVEENEIRKQTEIALIAARDEAESANKAKSLFLAKVSHELRTPMNGILGMTSILLDTNIDEKQRRSLNIVKHSGESLLNIINDLLDWSKIETGKLSLDSYPFKLREVLNYTNDLLYSISASKGIELRFHITNDVPDNLIGDPNRLHQVLVNLINNSIKFTEIGHIEVVVQKGVVHNNKVMLEFSIRDTGIGIDKDKIDRLFKSFSQIDNNLTRKYGGTGLGLAISKEIVEMMGGKIYCESTPEVGSVFHFTTFFEIQSEAAVNSDALENEFGTYSDIYPDFDLKILIAEDSLINQEVIKEALLKKNCRFEVVGNGHEAFEIFKKEKFDLIFMDLQMPVWDGYQAAEEIIKYEKANNIEHTPIVALTAHDDIDSKNACKNIGIDEFLTKPFKWHEIYKLLNKYNKRLTANSSIDLNAMLKTINNNTELLVKLMKYFIENVPKELELMNSYALTKDADSLKKSSHKLKSEVGNFGAEKATDLLREIEQLSRNGELELIEGLLKKLNEEIKYIIQYFKDYIEKNN